jgi:hypothetical protein
LAFPRGEKNDRIDGGYISTKTEMTKSFFEKMLSQLLILCAKKEKEIKRKNEKVFVCKSIFPLTADNLAHHAKAILILPT